MKNKLEQLLNSLIEKGWRIENPNARISDVKYMYGLRELRIVYETDRRDAVRQYPIRFLVSKESNLWQFVCENGMYKKEVLGLIFNDERAKNVFYKIDQFDEEGDVIQTGDMGGDEFIHISEPEYRLIESSLKDESELEDFLLSNIKVEG